ncbi:flavodoxin family protein, partial [Chloroflexota bacterium]
MKKVAQEYKTEVTVLGICGSPRKKGNTFRLLEKALSGAESISNVKTELYELAGRKIHPCIGCCKCFETGSCVYKDDFQEFLRKYMGADGLILGAPVYH